jgi:hypothetical protein
MKKQLFFLFAVLMSVSVNAQKNVAIEDAQARAFDVTPNSYVKPLTVELQVDQAKGRITDVWQLTAEEMLPLVNEKATDEQVKQNLRNYALFKSCQKHNCDVIVAPTFHLKSENIAKGITITVVGFVANFINWKTMDEKDVLWINVERADPRKVGQSYTPIYNRGN